MGDRWTLELLLTAAPVVGGNRGARGPASVAPIGAVEMVLKGCTACYDLSSSGRCRPATAVGRSPRPMPRSACAR